jgi:DNA-binding response OmpR family regulator
MRVLVIEDERKVAGLIRSGLEEQGMTVETCHDGDTGWTRATGERFDALVLDIMIPGRDGLGLLRKLRAERHTVPVLLLSARGDVRERVEGLEAGADDYLPKPFAMPELVARLRSIGRRHTGSTLNILSCGDLVLNLTAREVRRGGELIALTPREFSVLETLLRSPGAVVTRTELSQQIWGYQFDPETNVVDVAVQRLRRKIDDGRASRLIQTVRGMGYSIDAGAAGP